MTNLEITKASGDVLARQKALNTRESFIVKAPAGSGKTELLTSRFLKLLSEVDAPEQILAITFTRAATAEMRNRILSELEKARDQAPSLSDDEKRKLARQALLHAERHGWNLLQQPRRLRIETIDSFCASLARQTPILSRLGGELNPTENAGPLYQLAARRTLQQVGGTRPYLSEAIRELLLLRDSNFGACESLLAQMLEHRDQWSHAIVLGPNEAWNEQTEAQVRRHLEAPFQRAMEKGLRKAHDAFSTVTDSIDELLALARFACTNLREPECEEYESHLNTICALDSLNTLPGIAVDQLDAWKAISCFLLTKSGEWRKKPNKRVGFPSGRTTMTEMKSRFDHLRDRLSNVPGLMEALCETSDLPPARYSDEQWQLLRHFFTALRHATAELRVAFAERNEIDFVELGLAAELVLMASDPGAPDAGSEYPASTELALATGDRLRHLLVDEFQDISRLQHRLITLLVRGWDKADGRTCFFVGDPMQSIYMFRQAEVEIFQDAYANGLRTSDGTLALTPLELTTNWRSDRELVSPLNHAFSAIFPAGHDAAIQVPFTPAEAMNQGGEPRVFAIHADFVPSDADDAAIEDAQQREAQKMLDILRQHQPAIEDAALQGSTYRVAILARAKNHLLHLTRCLRDANIRYRAVEMEELGERQEVIDLVSLVRALLHPMDRLAWLSILRAPWCGLLLADLHTLCGADDQHYRRIPVPELLRQRSMLLSHEGRLRAERLYAVLQRAAQLRSEQLSMQSFAALVERVWYSLGGPKCVDATGRENVELFLKMLSELPEGEIDCLGDELTRRLEKLYAQPDPETSEHCGVMLMTMHKAKGLGFEVVLVPALERQVQSGENDLLSWLERTVPTGEPDAGEDEILVAPIGAKGEDADVLKKWVERQRKAREAEEQKRLLYVACTRASKELHLFGLATFKHAGSEFALSPGPASSLLKTGWIAFETEFTRAWQRRQEAREAAAQAASGLLPFPGPLDMTLGDMSNELIDLAATAAEPRARLARLKREAFAMVPADNVTTTVTYNPHPDETAFSRPQGSLLARAFGVAVHTMLQRLASLLVSASVEEVRRQLRGWKPQITTLLVQDGVDLTAARAQCDRAIRALEGTLDDPEGRWVLSPHTGAETEAEWTGVSNGAVRRLRADRVFRGGKAALEPGEECFWIIDYKTSDYSSTGVEVFLDRQKKEYEQQLAAYADILRLRHGPHTEVRVGLYYPLLKRLTWWEN